jgi:hypothetical protein
VAAFRAVRRQLEDYERVRRQDVKRHTFGPTTLEQDHPECIGPQIAQILYSSRADISVAAESPICELCAQTTALLCGP